MSDKIYTSKITVEVVVEHWGDPFAAKDMVETLLKNPQVTAVRSVETLDVKSNYRLHQQPDSNLKAVEGLPVAGSLASALAKCKQWEMSEEELQELMR